jgi:hypothetical protein
MSDRAEGERIRARHEIARLQAMLASLTLDIERWRVGLEPGQAITQAACSLAVTLAKLEAFVTAAEDDRNARDDRALAEQGR